MINADKKFQNDTYNYDMISADKINPNDVLCGRGGLTNSHIGNKKYRYIVAEHQLEYLRARKNDKRTIARAVVSRIRENGGRFLQRSSDSDVWVVVSDKRATEKTSQALREGLDVRHKTVRPKKYNPKRNLARMSPKNSYKDESLANGVVVDSPRIRGISQEDVPGLMQESTTQLFEPFFTFSQLTTATPTAPIPETYYDKVHRI